MRELELTQAKLLRPVVACMERRGLDASRYLASSRVPREFIEMDHAPIPRRTAVWGFMGDVERREDIETLGFLMGDRLDLKDYGPFGKRVSRAASLYDAIRETTLMSARLVQGNNFRLLYRGRQAWFVCRSVREICRSADHARLLFLIEIVRLAAGAEWTPRTACLQSGPVDAIRDLPVLAGCEIAFNRDHTGVAVPVRTLSRPVFDYSGDPGASLPEIPRLSSSDCLSEVLKTVVETTLSYYGPPSASEAADLMGTSRATLFRRLSEEGVTYAQIVERTRYSAAERLLRVPDLSIKEIAYLLGYSAPSNFIRAFRNMAGVTPSHFRELQAAHQDP